MQNMWIWFSLSLSLSLSHGLEAPLVQRNFIWLDSLWRKERTHCLNFKPWPLGIFFPSWLVLFFGGLVSIRGVQNMTPWDPFFGGGRGGDWYVFWGLLWLVEGVEKLFCREVVQYIMDLMKRQTKEVRVCLFIRSIIILLKAKKKE